MIRGIAFWKIPTTEGKINKINKVKTKNTFYETNDGRDRIRNVQTSPS